MRITKRQLKRIIREEYSRIMQTDDDYKQMIRRRTGGARGAAMHRKRVMRDAVIYDVSEVVKQVEYMYPEIDREALQDAIFEVIEDATNTADL